MVEDLIERAKALSVEERIRLRDAIDETLDDNDVSDEGAAEIERRFAEFVQNGRRGIPLEQVMAELRTRRSAG